jgi:hypothetical protein
VKRLNSQNRRVLSAVAVTAALLVPLGIFGGPALARSASSAAEYQYGPSGQQYKVTICHRTHGKKGSHTIRVGAPAVKAHLKHGDSLGACPATAAQQAAKHGKAKGKSNDQAPSAQNQSKGQGSGSNNGRGNGNGNGNAGGNGNGNAGGNGKGHGK